MAKLKRSRLAQASLRSEMAELMNKKPDLTDPELAELFDVGVSTVTRVRRDLITEWRRNMSFQVDQRIRRQATDLDKMRGILEEDIEIHKTPRDRASLIQQYVAVERREAELLGLDAPKRTELTLDGGINIEKNETRAVDFDKFAEMFRAVREGNMEKLNSGQAPLLIEPIPHVSIIEGEVIESGTDRISTP